MNWLQKTILSQLPTIESIILSVATGTTTANLALQQLEQYNAPANECCNILLSFSDQYPQAQASLQEMFIKLRCSDVNIEQFQPETGVIESESMQMQFLQT